MFCDIIYRVISFRRYFMIRKTKIICTVGPAIDNVEALTFNIFDAGATAIGDGILISNGVSQLNELDEYIKIYIFCRGI